MSAPDNFSTTSTGSSSKFDKKIKDLLPQLSGGHSFNMNTGGYVSTTTSTDYIPSTSYSLTSALALQ